MKLKEIIKRIMKEEFKEWEKDRLGNTAPIYKNPTLKELRELKKETKDNDVRLLVDVKKKNVFVFPALLLHIDAGRALKIKPEERRKRYLEIIGKIKEDTIKVDTSFVSNKLKSQEKWLSKYRIIL